MSLLQIRPTTHRLKKIIKDLAADPNVTILVSSHDLLHTVEVSDRIAYAQGRGKGHSSPETLQELEQFLQFKLFWGMTKKSVVGFHSQSFISKIK
jgi:ABC-type Mn2+/Zn2+ transport system ATPase subunit